MSERHPRFCDGEDGVSVGVDCVKMTCNVRIWGDFGTVNVPPKSFRESPFIFQVVRYVLVI